MSQAFDINKMGMNIGALSNTFRVVGYVPATGGDITVLAANIMSNAAGTSCVNLVNLGAAGTAVAGTIGTLGTAVFSVGVPKAFTISSAIVDGGTWVGVEETNTGTTNAITIVDVSYVMGK